MSGALARSHVKVANSLDGRRRAQLVAVCPACSLRAYSTAAAEKTSFGGLQDKDRIFTNIYGRHDPFIKVGCRRAAAGSGRLWRRASQRHSQKLQAPPAALWGPAA